MLEKRVVESNNLAEWQALILEAEQKTAIRLSEELESYLVFLLMRFIKEPEILKSVVALDFLQSQEYPRQKRKEMLRDVGDKCLLLAGFFPGRAIKKRVRVSYFVNLGQSAYFTLSNFPELNISELYAKLCTHFVGLMDILYSVHTLNQEGKLIDLIQAEELWQDTKSVYALNHLRKSTNGFLVGGSGGGPSSLRH